MTVILLRKFGSKNISKNLFKSCKLNLCSEISKSPESSIGIKYVNGLAKFTVHLPSRSEICAFSMKPVSNNVGDFLKMLKTEDKGIDIAVVFDNEGVRVASSCSIEALLDEPFCLHINNESFHAEPPKKDEINGQNSSALANVKTLVGQLYEALQVGEHYANKERELILKLETLNQTIGPLEEKWNELNKRAEITTNLKTWLGLGLMSVQFGMLARLTWWEYSWDIMEPITFFIGYGTSLALYAYFCITKMEYNYNDVANRNYLLSIYNSARRKGLDIEEYKELKREITEVEFDLKRLKDPLYLQLPPHFQKSTVNQKLLLENSKNREEDYK